MNNGNELNEQELSQVVGGVDDKEITQEETENTTTFVCSKCKAVFSTAAARDLHQAFCKG